MPFLCGKVTQVFLTLRFVCITAVIGIIIPFLSSSVISHMTRQGFPAAITFDGISLVITEPEPITLPSPIADGTLILHLM